MLKVDMCYGDGGRIWSAALRQRPSRLVELQTPPRLAGSTVEAVRAAAVRVFTVGSVQTGAAGGAVDPCPPGWDNGGGCACSRCARGQGVGCSGWCCWCGCARAGGAGCHFVLMQCGCVRACPGAGVLMIGNLTQIQGSTGGEALAAIACSVGRDLL